MKGYFITFEGGEGTGKSTQIKFAEEYLRDKGYETIVTKEPRGKIRELLQHPDSILGPLAEVFLFYADRIQHLQYVVMPALKEGKIVLSDRHDDSTRAYQQYGRQLDAKLFSDIGQVLPIRPDLTILLDMPIEYGLQRSTQGEFGKKDRIESAGTEFHERVRQGFLQLARENPDRIKIIDSMPPKEEVHAKVVEILEDFLKN